jgi:hypothetical protein
VGLSKLNRVTNAGAAYSCREFLWYVASESARITGTSILLNQRKTLWKGGFQFGQARIVATVKSADEK